MQEQFTIIKDTLNIFIQNETNKIANAQCIENKLKKKYGKGKRHKKEKPVTSAL